jgi:CheY-like chemotaxis protein
MNNLETPLAQPAAPLLVIEDSDEDFEAMQRFFRLAPIDIPLQRCLNGEQALAFLDRTGSYTDPQVSPRPCLIVLDLNLPKTDGREVLKRIKQNENLKSIPVVIFTTSNNPKDMEICYRYGIKKYIVKPIDFSLLKQNMQTLIDYWLEVTFLTTESGQRQAAFLKKGKQMSEDWES